MVVGLWSERQEADSVDKFIGLHGFRDQVKIVHAFAYGYIEVVSIEKPSEEDPSLLAALCLDEEIPVL